MNQNSVQHFILTRFNLLLFNKDKEGNKVRTIKWLDHRFLLFEKYCLPSVKNQTCQEFTWIVLFDSSTPDKYKTRIAGYQKECPQLTPIYVEPKNGRYFADIFRNEIIKRLEGKRLLTTYLDNDDSLNIKIIEDLQNRITSVKDDTFIFYDDGYQLFTDHKYMMKIHYPRNHFVSYVENGNPSSLKSVFGFGGHYYIFKIKGARIEHIQNTPMWCEVIHEKNMGNDAYFLKANMVKDEGLLFADFGVQEKIGYGWSVYMFRFLPRYMKTFFRRCGYRLFGRHW